MGIRGSPGLHRDKQFPFLESISEWWHSFFKDRRAVGANMLPCSLVQEYLLRSAKLGGSFLLCFTISSEPLHGCVTAFLEQTSNGQCGETLPQSISVGTLHGSLKFIVLKPSHVPEIKIQECCAAWQGDSSDTNRVKARI